MGKSSASKQEMMMRDKQMMKPKKMPMMDSQGFPVVPKEHKFADDLGYRTKAKKSNKK